jgi:hypothetical protein
VAVALGCAYAIAGRVGEALPLLDLANKRARSLRGRKFLAHKGDPSITEGSLMRKV